jgi:hypothetical protein
MGFGSKGDCFRNFNIKGNKSFRRRENSREEREAQGPNTRGRGRAKKEGATG